jgi:transposase
VGRQNQYKGAAEETINIGRRSTHMNHYVGIDNSSADHKVRIIDEKGNLNLSFSITNTFDGFEELNTKLSGLSDMRIGFELPHGPLVDYLHLKDYHLYSLNPLKIKRFKESLKVAGNKTDDIDAHAIAEYLRMNSTITRELVLNSSEIEGMKTLSIIHSRLVHDRARHLNKLHFSVRQYFHLHEMLFRNFGCKTQLKMIIKYPSFSNLKKVSDEEIIKFLKDHKYRRGIYINRLIEKFHHYNQLVPPEVESAYQMEAVCLCKILLILDEDINRIEKEMNSIADAHSLGKYFKSLPGAGLILSGKLLAIFGDNKDRFANYSAAQCFFGTAPRNYQSGKYHKVLMRKACNKSGRAVLYDYAFSSIKFSRWARAYYDNQRAKGKTNSVALRSLSNKWVKIIFKIWKDEVLYQEDKIFSAAA